MWNRDWRSETLHVWLRRNAFGWFKSSTIVCLFSWYHCIVLFRTRMRVASFSFLGGEGAGGQGQGHGGEGKCNGSSLTKAKSWLGAAGWGEWHGEGSCPLVRLWIPVELSNIASGWSSLGVHAAKCWSATSKPETVPGWAPKARESRPSLPSFPSLPSSFLLLGKGGQGAISPRNCLKI